MKRILLMLLLVPLACICVIAQVQISPSERLSDDDNDGVINSRDKCPRSGIDYRVDYLGCTRYHTTEQKHLLAIEFVNGSGYLHPKYYPQIEQLAAILEKQPSVKVLIEGHASNQGNDPSVNYKLSVRRARMVAKTLIEHFAVSARRVSTVGRGATALKLTGDNPVFHQHNRRVNAILSDRVPLKRSQW